ncbi:uncharacterized protein B0H18DRAFT_1044628 [Fomitopsis serialis]|uniref:uncharacterized protein n=1 Tax=Fomitopsis serialis TaxID=139415 RepID=UPI00200885B8|nr:uncharacterized protein B0H18DRAFT_1044628 [Neoantrodia serialis]KAH9914603.1 hypothetical protein B0H18DRAFT_1044628 [Neoantrodia serialis]
MSMAEAAIYAQEAFTSSCVDVASNALLLYEYITTSDSEISLFWVRKWPASIVFFLVRFLMLATALFGLATMASAEITNVRLNHCMASIIFSMFIQFTSLAMIAVVSAMRVYAVNGHRWLAAAFTLIVGAAPVGVNVYAASQASIYLTDGICSYHTMTTSREGFIFALLSRLCTITCDIIVVTTIWVETYGLMKTHVRPRSYRQSLIWYLLRDGTIYFILMLVLNIVDICLVYFDDEVDFIHSIILPFSLILISRLLINLREVAYRRDMDRTTLSTSSFEIETPFEISTVFFDPAVEIPEECFRDEGADEIEMIHRLREV